MTATTGDEKKTKPPSGQGVKQWSLKLIFIYAGLGGWLLWSWVHAGPAVFAALSFNLVVLAVVIAAGSFTRTISLKRLSALFLWGGFMLGVAVMITRSIATGLISNPGLSENLSAFVEEGCKLGPVLCVLFAGRRFSIWALSATDLLLMGAAAGAGFSFLADAFAHPSGAWPGQLRWIPTAEIVNGRMAVGNLLWTALAGSTIGLGMLLRTRGRLAVLVGVSGFIVAALDHATFSYGAISHDWLFTVMNVITLNGYLPLVALCLLYVVAVFGDAYVQSRTLPRFSEFSLPTGLEGLEGLQALWEFTLDRRRLAMALFQYESSAPEKRKPIGLVVSLLTQTLINSHSKERRQRSRELINEMDVTLSPAMEDHIVEGTAGEENFDDLDLPEQYRVLAPISEGGMGIIFRANHVHTGQKLAIKVLHPTLARQASAIERFKQEAKAVGSLSHPNLVVVTDFGITERRHIPFLVMEFIPGISLADTIKDGNILPPNRFFDIFDQVLDALSHAHKRWVIHRDLKPSNILISPTDNNRDLVKIVDFGIAKLMSASDGISTQELTRTGDLIGSPLYMSPEQGLGAHIDARSDIYSIGCVMYECLIGHPPFVGANAVHTIMKQVSEQAIGLKEAKPELNFPPSLDHLIMKALEKDPGRRFQTMDQMRSTLNAIRHSQSVSVQQEPTQEFRTLASILNPGLFRKK